MVPMIVIIIIAALVDTVGVLQMKQTDSAFEEWYNGMVGFHINSERIYDDLCDENVSPETLRKWMVVCWNTALGEAELVTDQSLWQLKEKP